MRRKIIRQGHSTLTVTLPALWAKRFNLRAGEEVNIIERDNGLFMTTERVNGSSEIDIDIRGLNIQLIWKHINVAYRAGFDKIKIKFNPEDRYESPYKYFAHYIPDSAFKRDRKLTPGEFITQLSSRYIGFEVIDKGKDYCVMQEIGQSTSKEFDSSLRRIFLLLLEMSEGIIFDLQNHKTEFLDRAHEIDTQIDKFHDFCARVLSKTGIEDPVRSSLTFLLIYILELVGDEYKHLAIQLVKKDLKKLNTEKLISLLKSINQQINLFYKLNYKYEREGLIELSQINSLYLHNGSSKENGFKEDVQVTIESINRYIDVLSEILIARNLSSQMIKV